MSQNRRWKSTSVCFLFSMIMFNGYDCCFLQGYLPLMIRWSNSHLSASPTSPNPKFSSKPLVAFHGDFPKEINAEDYHPPKRKINSNWEPECLHPGRLAWNLRIHPWKRKIIFQCPSFSSSMLIFQGVHHFSWTGNFLQGPWGLGIFEPLRFVVQIFQDPWGPPPHIVSLAAPALDSRQPGSPSRRGETPQPPGFARFITSTNRWRLPLCGQPLKVIFWATK